MILFINTYITEEKVLQPLTYVRENAKPSDKLDIYKYMLASLSDFYPWTRVIINTKLDDFYSPRREELNSFIMSEFGKYDLLIRDFRREKQSEWQEEFSYFNDNLIMYLGNHDHIFIDSDLKSTHNIIDRFKDSNEYQAIQFSHFPEMVMLPICPWEPLGNIEIYEDYFCFDINNVHAIQIINKEVYKYWWFKFEFPDLKFGRTDMFAPINPINSYAKFKNLKFINLYKEIARHFDAYQHNHIFKFTNDLCPVLEIPDGFWNNNIKINYSTKYRDGFTNINPLNDKLKIFDNSGSDLNITKKYIPHFWKKRISQFNDDFKLLKEIWTEDELDDIHLERMMQIWNNIPTRIPELKTYLLNNIRNQSKKIKPFSL